MATKPPRPKQTPEEEMLSRMRRMETRITQLLIGLGIHTDRDAPKFDKQPGEHATLTLPSPHSSMKEIQTAIPAHFAGRIVLRVGRDEIGQLDVCARS